MIFPKRDREEQITGLIMVLPILILLSIFVIAPLIIAIYPINSISLPGVLFRFGLKIRQSQVE